MSEKKPNIVYFFWDNFGWGELGCYGGGRCAARLHRGAAGQGADRRLPGLTV